MKPVVPQPAPRQSFGRRRVARTAKRARCAETDIIEQNEQDVWRSLRSAHRNREVGLRVLRPQVNAPAKRLRRPRQDRHAVLSCSLLALWFILRGRGRLASRIAVAQRSRQGHNQHRRQSHSTSHQIVLLAKNNSTGLRILDRIGFSINNSVILKFMDMRSPIGNSIRGL